MDHYNTRDWNLEAQSTQVKEQSEPKIPITNNSFTNIDHEWTANSFAKEMKIKPDTPKLISKYTRK